VKHDTRFHVLRPPFNVAARATFCGAPAVESAGFYLTEGALRRFGPEGVCPTCLTERERPLCDCAHCDNGWAECRCICGPRPCPNARAR
jgi:hypothetical protein